MKLDHVHIRTCVQKVPLCGCGSTDRMWEIVRDALQRSQDITDTWDREREEERISGKRGAGRVVGFYEPMGSLPADAVEFVAQVLDTSGFLEHGSSVQCAWLTAAGRALLLFLRKYGVDREKWPEWATQSMDPEPFSLDAEKWRAFSRQGRDGVNESDIP